MNILSPFLVSLVEENIKRNDPRVRIVKTIDNQNGEVVIYDKQCTIHAKLNQNAISKLREYYHQKSLLDVFIVLSSYEFDSSSNRILVKDVSFITHAQSESISDHLPTVREFIELRERGKRKGSTEGVNSTSDGSKSFMNDSSIAESQGFNPVFSIRELFIPSDQMAILDSIWNDDYGNDTLIGSMSSFSAMTPLDHPNSPYASQEDISVHDFSISRSEIEELESAEEITAFQNLESLSVPSQPTREDFSIMESAEEITAFQNQDSFPSQPTREDFSVIESAEEMTAFQNQESLSAPSQKMREDSSELVDDWFSESSSEVMAQHQMTPNTPPIDMNDESSIDLLGQMSDPVLAQYSKSPESSPSPKEIVQTYDSFFSLDLDEDRTQFGTDDILLTQNLARTQEFSQKGAIAMDDWSTQQPIQVDDSSISDDDRETQPEFFKAPTILEKEMPPQKQQAFAKEKQVPVQNSMTPTQKMIYLKQRNKTAQEKEKTKRRMTSIQETKRFSAKQKKSQSAKKLRSATLAIENNEKSNSLGPFTQGLLEKQIASNPILVQETLAPLSKTNDAYTSPKKHLREKEPEYPSKKKKIIWENYRARQISILNN